MSNKMVHQRYTNEEKLLLYSLFSQYEEVIDINKRRAQLKGRKISEIRQSWEEIMHIFNASPVIATRRNLKQIQKFWLNSRLRNMMPSVKDEALDVKYKASMVAKQEKVDEISVGPEEVHEEIVYTEYDQTEENDTEMRENESDDDELLSIDRLSPDKLTLNDLLEFKEVVPRIDSIRTTVEQQSSAEENKKSPTDERSSGESPPEKPQPNTCCGHQQPSPNDEKIKYWLAKEAEIKFKEGQVKFRQQQVELIKSREELKHTRRIRQMQVEEMRLKLKILAEQERRLRDKNK